MTENAPKALIYKGFCKRSITELHGFRDLDSDFVKGTISGEHFSELFYPNCKDEHIGSFLKAL